MALRILVCGGRDYQDWKRVYKALDHLQAKRGISCIIHGAAPGADTLAAQWAKERGVIVEPWAADWKRWGNAAGPKRNAEMIREGRPDAVVAFPGGPGTADCTRQAEAAGLKVWRPYG